MYLTTTAGGMTMGFPNVCNTPSSPSPIPVPYPTIGQCSTADMSTCSVKVKVQNKNVMTLKSKVMKTQGDEAGTVGGVTSGVFGNLVTRTKGSTKLLVEGSPGVRQLDTAGSNGPSPNCPVATQTVMSQLKVLVLT